MVSSSDLGKVTGLALLCGPVGHSRVKDMLDQVLKLCSRFLQVMASIFSDKDIRRTSPPSPLQFSTVVSRPQLRETSAPLGLSWAIMLAARFGGDGLADAEMK
jgi:hypothetical protein